MPRGAYRVMHRETKCSHPLGTAERLVPTHCPAEPTELCPAEQKCSHPQSYTHG